MILTVTPNAAIDKTYTVEGFGLDRVHRPSESRTVAGGKGINVVRVLKELGQKGFATGFVGGAIGNAIIAGLTEEAIPHDFVRVKDESRLCIAVMDPKNGTQTEINENGPLVSVEETEELFGKIRRLVAGKEYIVLSGSVPPSIGYSFYGDIIEIARRVGVRAVLDTSGEHLKEAIKAGPYMVKPNVTELSQLAETELVTLEEISSAAKSLRQYGVSIAVITMGKAGAILTDGVQVWMAVPPEIKFASAVGSGDAFLAAFLATVSTGGSMQEALVRGTAAGAENATTYGAGFCSKDRIAEIEQGVVLTKLD